MTNAGMGLWELGNSVDDMKIGGQENGEDLTGGNSDNRGTIHRISVAFDSSCSNAYMVA